MIVAHNMVCMNAQSCPPVCDPIECNLPGSSISGMFQAKILERVAISSSRGSFRSRDQKQVSCSSCLGRQILYHWATWEALNNTEVSPNPGSYVRGTVRPNKHKHQGLEQTKVYFRVSSKKNQMARAQKTQTQGWFSGKFLKAKFGKRATGYVTFYWLIDGEVRGGYIWSLDRLLVPTSLGSRSLWSACSHHLPPYEGS